MRRYIYRHAAVSEKALPYLVIAVAVRIVLLT
jgi:hypothetical protein